MSKASLGQFYTTRYKYIFDGMKKIKKSLIVIEPFCGKGDLLGYLNGNPTELYDIDPKYPNTIKRDTLANPPEYQGKFVLTNPPYLARNKCKNKDIFEKYSQNDLYKCFINNIIDDPPIGGLIIIPLNFWCSIRKSDCYLRKRFLEIFKIVRLNIFEEPVFNDTMYTVCGVLFVLRSDNTEEIDTYIYPGPKNIKLKLINWIIGGELYSLENTGKYQVSRLLKGGSPNTKIFLKAIDDTKEKQICLCISKTPYFGKMSARTYATLIIKPKISERKQKEIVEKFNKILYDAREKYHSLFLTNYRENTRKRISFDLVYSIVLHILSS